METILHLLPLTGAQKAAFQAINLFIPAPKTLSPHPPPPPPPGATPRARPGPRAGV